MTKFEAFLTWLYKQDLTDLSKLPQVVRVSGSTGSYRRAGPQLKEAKTA